MRHGTLVKQGSRASIYRVQSFSVKFHIILKPCEREHIAYCILTRISNKDQTKLCLLRQIFVVSKVLSRQTHVCHDKHNFVATKLLSQKVYFCHNKRCVLSWQTRVCHDKRPWYNHNGWLGMKHLLTYLSWQMHVCRNNNKNCDKNDACGSSCHWYTSGLWNCHQQNVYLKTSHIYVSTLSSQIHTISPYTNMKENAQKHQQQQNSTGNPFNTALV